MSNKDRTVLKKWGLFRLVRIKKGYFRHIQAAAGYTVDDAIGREQGEIIVDHFHGHLYFFYVLGQYSSLDKAKKAYMESCVHMELKDE